MGILKIGINSFFIQLLSHCLLWWSNQTAIQDSRWKFKHQHKMLSRRYKFSYQNQLGWQQKISTIFLYISYEFSFWMIKLIVLEQWSSFNLCAVYPYIFLSFTIFIMLIAHNNNWSIWCICLITIERSTNPLIVDDLSNVFQETIIFFEQNE